MEVEELTPSDVVRARAFWAEADVDAVFSEICEYMNHLQYAFKNNTATDQEFVQGMKIVTLLESALTPPPSDSFIQLVIGAELLSDPPDPLLQDKPSSPSSPQPSNGLSPPPSPPAAQELLLPPLVAIQAQYKPHHCTTTCLPGLPRTSQPFWGQNPLKVPLLCGFQRQEGLPAECWEDGDASEVEQVTSEGTGLDVVYKAPCGLSLRSYEDVMRFLFATESCDVLQVEFFSFNPEVRLDPPRPVGPNVPEQDLSRGLEASPVQLCPGEDRSRPPDFRYRKDRWPPGCFLTRDSALFDTCCDCTDGCTDPERCACLALTSRGCHYSHHRLREPLASGLYECGPWCGCSRSLCQIRLVQQGIRIRLQVFQTPGRGWGVRCRDDLDQGTFVCTFSGIVLTRWRGLDEAPPTKRSKAESQSDDEVEVVTEWLSPSVTVIQRASDSAHSLQDNAGIQTVVLGGPEPEQLPPVALSPQSPNDGTTDQSGSPDQVVGADTEDGEPVAEEEEQEEEQQNHKEVTEERKARMRREEEDGYFLDASKEGNVARFINSSCQPNLLVQNVFTDSQDRCFPVIAFFTNRVIKAGTELTWSGFPETENALCSCGADGCRGHTLPPPMTCTPPTMCTPLTKCTPPTCTSSRSADPEP